MGRAQPFVMIRILIVILALIGQACDATPAPTPSPPASPGRLPSASTAPPPPELSIPAAPEDAANYLALHAMDPTDGPAAVTELITRAGIAIVSADNGALLNDPVKPTLVDAYVYDAEIPDLAKSLHANEAWTLDQIAGFVSAIAGTAGGPEIPAAELQAAATQWVAEGSAGLSPSFGALAFRALGTNRAAPPDASGPVDPKSLRLDPIQFLLFGSALLSRSGTLTRETATLPRPGSIVLAAAGDGCETLKKQIDKDPTGLGSKGLKDTFKKLAGKGIAAASKAFDLIADGLAAGLLLAGVRLTVTDDMNHALHYRHKDTFDPHEFIATATFDSTFPTKVIHCLGLAGVKLPDNGPMQGWVIRWVLQQDGQHVVPIEGQSTKLERGFGGGGGENTNANGQSKLGVEVALEAACPGKFCGISARQGHGNVTATAKLDVPGDAAPLKLADFFSLSNIPKAAGKLVIDTVKRLGLPNATDVVAVTWHAPAAMVRTVTNVDNSLPWQISTDWRAWSCDGLNGQWTGKVNVRVGAGHAEFQYGWTYPRGAAFAAAHQTSAAVKEAQLEKGVSTQLNRYPRAFNVQIQGNATAPSLVIGKVEWPGQDKPYPIAPYDAFPSNQIFPIEFGDVPQCK